VSGSYEHISPIILILNCKMYQLLSGIALGYGLDDPGVRVPTGAGNLSLHLRVQNGSGAHPASYQWVSGALSLGVKRPRREVDHSPLPSAVVKNEWS
jgi:hypothetical protein